MPGLAILKESAIEAFTSKSVTSDMKGSRSYSQLSFGSFLLLKKQTENSQYKRKSLGLWLLYGTGNEYNQHSEQYRYIMRIRYSYTKICAPLLQEIASSVRVGRLYFGVMVTQHWDTHSADCIPSVTYQLTQVHRVRCGKS